MKVVLIMSMDVIDAVEQVIMLRRVMPELM